MKMGPRKTFIVILGAKKKLKCTITGQKRFYIAPFLTADINKNLPPQVLSESRANKIDLN